MLNKIKEQLILRKIVQDETEIKFTLIVIGILIVVLFGGLFYIFTILNKNQIKSYTSDESFSPTATISVTSAPSPTPIESAPTATPKPLDKSTATPGTKDYYVNLGSGSNRSLDWTDVSGTLTTVDLSQYSNIKEVHLETTINVPTANGTVSVRLFNKTDGYAVWNSERTVQAQSSDTFIISQSLIYDVGPKFYQVQIKSQLNVSANLLQSRLHIVAN